MRYNRVAPVRLTSFVHGISIEQFEIGAFYEIDHEKLPPKSPIQLKAIRVVKVTETSELDVTVSFPSTLSLRNYFSFYPADGREPELDERFVMSLKQAVRILRRPVPSSTWEEEKNLESFWLVAPRAYDCQPLASLPATAAQEAAEEEGRTSEPMGYCLLALQSAGTLGWGIRRKEEQQVGQKRTREACKKEKEENKKRKKKKEDKRERKMPRHEEEKKRKCEKESRVKASKDRWSSERYEAAEMKLLEIMKEKGAELGNPIMRQALREEARKHIGDTGLLDHLLKHMDGKTVAGGTERFRRRHNAEGAMEYWLEPAELVEIRRKAGVMDLYWIPPPGWKPGDAVSPCPCGTECKRDIRELREEIAVLKRDMELLSSLRNLEKVAKEIRPEVDNGSGTWEERYQSLLESNSKMEENMSALSSHLLELKEEIRLLKEEKDKKTEVEAEMVTKDKGWLDGGDDNKEEEERGKQQQSKNTMSTKSSTTNDNSSSTRVTTPPTTIANANSNNNNNNNDGSGGGGGGKRTVRRSGFRICKPQGTFLWPNSAALISSSSRRNGADVVGSSSLRAQAQGLMVPAATTATTATLEDQLMFFGGIPTPPSASSATSAPNLLLLPAPTSPVLPRVPDPAAAEVVVVPSSYQRHQQQQQQQERTASSENICPSVHRHHLPTARGTSSPLGGGGGENKKKEALWELAQGGGWSNITTDLALATPSSYR
ncbi:protein AMEIOTIC 1 homolog [Phoenix dactylifera]|uniref:Protein AMEIOTIC 1 homolog n=1 Tax=Phoenix dactylifera TaxID=42345 RepID=A0A8B8ZEZ8_PHODC|nr:protein AMEIOTIC 1 homolog [Phoenix dactylifera]